MEIKKEPTDMTAIKQEPVVVPVKREAEAKTSVNKNATQMEVLGLRTQVAYLQDMIDDLRTQINSVMDVLDDAGVPKDNTSTKKNQGRTKGNGMKRPRSEGLLEVKKYTMPVEPIMLKEVKTDNKPEELLSSNEVDQVAELLDIKEEKSEAFMDLMEDLQDLPDLGTTDSVIKSISQATELDQDSVSKIISYFSELTTKDEAKGEGTGVRPESALHKLNDSFHDLEVKTLQAQKVGAT